MKDEKYSSFINSLGDVPPLPESVYLNVLSNNKKTTVHKFIKFSSALAAVLIAAFIFTYQYQTEITEVDISSNIEEEIILLDSLFIDNEYDDFDEYYPLINL